MSEGGWGYVESEEFVLGALANPHLVPQEAAQNKGKARTLTSQEEVRPQALLNNNISIR
jgi:hypothetical protein